MSDGVVPTIASMGATPSQVAATPALALVGATLEGAYTIARLIAEGGMSAVYEATQLRLNQRVAVKVLARSLASNEEALARFRREAEITSRLRHPHLVTVTDFGTAPDGQPYLVMEYLEGTDLDHRIRKVGRLPLTTVVHITKQVASALAAAHDQGIVHRDLKPANIFLVELPGEPDFAKVLDFGISKVRAASSQLTKATSIIGTPNYMSPEQASGQLDDIDERTDQWALACIVWEMLAGRPPFASDDVSAVFYQVINLDPQPIARRAPDLPRAVEGVLLRALSKNMAERYPSVRDFADALASAASERNTGWVEGRNAERRQTRLERRRSHSIPAPGDPAVPDDPALVAAARDSFPNAVRLTTPRLVAVGVAVLVLATVLLLRRGDAPKPVAPSPPASATVPTPPAPTTPPPPTPPTPPTIVAPPVQPSAIVPTSPPVPPPALAPVLPPAQPAPAAVAPPPAAPSLHGTPAAPKPSIRPAKDKATQSAPETSDAADPFENLARPVPGAAPTKPTAKPPRHADTKDPVDSFAPHAPPSQHAPARARQGAGDFVDPFAP